mmetsp:Transcript_12944/g.39840  ORF Transcript_12944/g.39840 Transcript_12944/m.39840 type:complete len:521 (+) Transcript_12944:99-1661(+)
MNEDDWSKLSPEAAVNGFRQLNISRAKTSRFFSHDGSSEKRRIDEQADDVAFDSQKIADKDQKFSPLPAVPQYDMFSMFDSKLSYCYLPNTADSSSQTLPKLEGGSSGKANQTWDSPYSSIWTSVPASGQPSASTVDVLQKAQSQTASKPEAPAKKERRSQLPVTNAREENRSETKRNLKVSSDVKARTFFPRRAADVQPFEPSEHRVNRAPKENSANAAKGASSATGAPSVPSTPTAVTSPTSEVQKTPVLCKFFMDGYCANGDSCRFVHNLNDMPVAVSPAGPRPGPAPFSPPAKYSSAAVQPDESAYVSPEVGPALNASSPMFMSGLGNWDLSGELCSFHATNECRYGTKCRYLHGNQCPTCLSNVLHPLNPELSAEHLRACSNLMNMSAVQNVGPPENQDEISCGLCMNQTRTLGRKFGLLENCTHAFCLECLREYRGNDLNGRSVKECPICFVESELVVPSFTFVTDHARRKELFASHIERLASIPCKHYNYGNGTCPYSNGCYYAHEDLRSSWR